MNRKDILGVSAISMYILFGTAAYFENKQWLLISLLAILLVGIAQMYLGWKTQELQGRGGVSRGKPAAQMGKLLTLYLVFILLCLITLTLIYWKNI